jgi:hypothetical protein
MDMRAAGFDWRLEAELIRGKGGGRKRVGESPVMGGPRLK